MNKNRQEYYSRINNQTLYNLKYFALHKDISCQNYTSYNYEHAAKTPEETKLKNMIFSKSKHNKSKHLVSFALVPFYKKST